MLKAVHYTLDSANYSLRSTEW